MDSKDQSNKQTENFSLVLGGPLYQLYLRTFLAKPPLDLYPRRIIIISLLAWLPLLILSIINGTAFGGVDLPFIYDIEIHVRFLIALALFVAAELIVHLRLRVIVNQFLERNIITSECLPRFNKIITNCMHLRNSIVIEIFLIAVVFTFGQYVWRHYLQHGVATWYAVPVDGQFKFTLPGYWYAFISLPLFQFIMLRWYFRLFIWYKFLWQVSRLPLNLNSLHPDRSAGIGFIANSVYAFLPLILAHTVLVSGMIVNRILYTGATLPDFKIEIVGTIGYLIVITLLPTCFYMMKISEAKRAGLIRYGMIASGYVNAFRLKWLTKDEAQEKILGSADIQSLADLSNSFQVAQDMRILPFTLRSLIQLIIISALPMFPLALTMFKFEEIIQFAIKLIM